MLVDSERVLVELKAEIAAKPSHGSRDLLATIGRLEAEHRMAADDFERWVRRFSHHLFDSFMGLMPDADQVERDPLSDAAASALLMAGTPHLRRSQGSEESCQKTHSTALAR